MQIFLLRLTMSENQRRLTRARFFEVPLDAWQYLYHGCILALKKLGLLQARDAWKALNSEIRKEFHITTMICGFGGV